MPYLILFFFAAAVLYPIWQYFELKKFRVTTYETTSKKMKSDLKIIVLADLHAHVYGKDNDILIQKIKEQQPDLILAAGDMIVSKYPKTCETAYRVFESLVETAPVYFSNGNHESRVSRGKAEQTSDYLEYENRVRRLGVHILNNEREEIKIHGERICISGLEIPLGCYKKGDYEPLPPSFVREALGETREDRLELLLAHNPMYAEIYSDWGADITFCGHNHGGLVRIPGIGSLISPQFELFPKYDAGEFDLHGKKVYVSKGLGTHTFHIRIFNRAEVLLIRVHGTKAS